MCFHTTKECSGIGQRREPQSIGHIHCWPDFSQVLEHRVPIWSGALQESTRNIFREYLVSSYLDKLMCTTLDLPIWQES